MDILWTFMPSAESAHTLLGNFQGGYAPVHPDPRVAAIPVQAGAPGVQGAIGWPGSRRLRATIAAAADTFTQTAPVLLPSPLQSQMLSCSITPSQQLSASSLPFYNHSFSLPNSIFTPYSHPPPRFLSLMFSSSLRARVRGGASPFLPRVKPLSATQKVIETGSQRL